ncbi:MAG TPA: hypothetical protein VJX29_09900 [Candidatus Acidoferrales bacterium]|nr:hypothetical protein [Candidatus Acidoferrales bacterium]
MGEKLGTKKGEAARSLLLSGERLKLNVGRYIVEKDGLVLTILDQAGRMFGRVTLSPSEERRGALWLRDSLAGEFSFGHGHWKVFPIVGGKLATHALRVDPICYLIGELSDGVNKAKRASRADKAFRLASPSTQA